MQINWFSFDKLDFSAELNKDIVGKALIGMTNGKWRDCMTGDQIHSRKPGILAYRGMFGLAFLDIS